MWEIENYTFIIIKYQSVIEITDAVYLPFWMSISNEIVSLWKL